MQKQLIIIGLILVLLGVFWPWLQKAGLFRLPGDIVIERENSRFYFPLTSVIITSVIVSIIFWLFRK